MPCSLGFHIFDLVLKLDILMSCFQLEDFNNIDEVWVQQLKARNNQTYQVIKEAQWTRISNHNVSVEDKIPNYC